MRSHLFVFSGPAGAGKSTALRTAASRGLAVFQKDSTRLPRADEVLSGCPDTMFVSHDEFATRSCDPDFWTFTDECEWGVNIRELRAFTSLHPLVCCSIHVPAIIPRLQSVLPEVEVVGVFVYTDDAVRHERIAATEGSAREHAARANCAQPVLARFSKQPLAYRHVILNIFGKATFERHVVELLQHYAQQGYGFESNCHLAPLMHGLLQPQPGGLVVSAA